MNRFVRALRALPICLWAFSLVPAAPPAEVTNLQWCSGPKDCLSWSNLGPVQHRVYRGDRTTLPALLNGAADSCLERIWTGAATTGPGAITEVPPPGGFFWYLVVGKSCEGEGSAGNATAATRTLDSSGDCDPASCIDGMQNGAEAGVDCGGGSCPGCPNGASCCAGVDCSGAVCQAATCSVPTCVDTVRNGFETDVDCGGPNCPRCADGRQCLGGNDCQSFVCAFGVCQAPTCTDVVKNQNETDVDCGGGLCPPCAVGRTCNAGSDCTTGVCQAGVCTALPNGSLCTGSSQCASGNCVDGVCCNGACGALCQACNIAGSLGTCSNIPPGQDPANECAGSTTCNGAGSCSLFSNGHSCTLGGECLSGSCVDGVCCNTACGSLCQACSAVKKGSGADGTCGTIGAGLDPDNECAGAATCNGAGACSSPNGTACAVGSQCQSGNCADGVCCNTTCGGQCQACNIAGSLGTCSNIPAGQDPANECAGSTTCSGAGSCSLFTNGHSCTLGGECLSGSCVDGVCCNSACGSLCQACSAVKKGSGADGTCGTIGAGLDPDNECAGATTCNGAGACSFADGTACVLGSQCQSGNCVDGVCCNTACTGTCQACTAVKKGSGTDGTCGVIAINTDPDNECVDAGCDGTGACFPPQ